MSIETFDPLDKAFLAETKMSVPSGHAAMVAFMQSEGFLDHLMHALVEIEEQRMDEYKYWDCLADACDHPEGECPDPPGVGCGDAKLIVEWMLHQKK